MKELDRNLAYDFRELNQEQFEVFLKAILKDNQNKRYDYGIISFEKLIDNYNFFSFEPEDSSWLLCDSMHYKNLKLTSALELFDNEKPKQYQIGIDTIERSKANLTPENILSICQFQIDKYTWRKKNQDIEDFEKVIYYANWAIETLNISKTTD